MKLEHHLSKLVERQQQQVQAAVGGSSPATANFGGTWINELNSMATITQNADGSLTGSYTSPVSIGGGPATGPLLGFATGNFISFTVNWTGLDSVTTWAGQATLDNAGNVTQFATLWLLVAELGTSPSNWAATLAGSDTFAPYLQVIVEPGIVIPNSGT